MEPINQPLNASEPWIIYDTVQIRGNKATKNEAPVPAIAGFKSLTELAAAQSVSFFNVRKQGDPGVGEAYNNQDSADSFPFAFVLRSLGLEFAAPRALAGLPLFNEQGVIDGKVSNHAINQMFEQELIRHCAVHLKVSQDEKLLAAAMFLPSGTGLAGFGQAGVDSTGQIASTPTSPAGSIRSAATGAAHVGDAALYNRFTWKDGLNIPKGTNVKAELVFSEYAKRLLTAMGVVDMPVYLFQNPSDPLTATGASGTFSIRMSMIGTRLVQQRNELHVS